MREMEYQGVTPEEIIRELESRLKQDPKEKYTFQVGLKDLDFDVDEDKLDIHGVSLPLQNILLAEEALMSGIIKPAKLLEYDGTEHNVIAFDPRPVGFSGFMNCVTHSLVLTNLGLFNVGRYSAISLTRPGHEWGWFLHRRLATHNEVISMQEAQGLTPRETIEVVYKAFSGLSDQ